MSPSSSGARSRFFEIYDNDLESYDVESYISWFVVLLVVGSTIYPGLVKAVELFPKIKTSRVHEKMSFRIFPKVKLLPF